MAPVRHETPAEAIHRIGELWESKSISKGLRSEPSKLAMFETRMVSRIRVVPGRDWSVDALEVAEVFEMRSGLRYECRAKGDVTVKLVFGRRHGEPAVEMRRPATRLARVCNPPDYPEPEVELPEVVGRFKLSGDQLIGYDPPLEKRVYLPVQ